MPSTTARYLPEGWTLPAVTDENRAFFTSGELMVQRCSSCGTVQHPPEEDAVNVRVLMGYQDFVGPGQVGAQPLDLVTLEDLPGPLVSPDISIRQDVLLSPPPSQPDPFADHHFLGPDPLQRLGALVVGHCERRAIQLVDHAYLVPL